MEKDTTRLKEMFRRNFPAAVREEETVDRLLSNPENRVFFADEAGAAVLTQNNVLLLAVDEAFRRRGIGSALLEECEKAARAAGFSKLTVGAGAGGYLVPGVPTSRQPWPETLREERLDPRLTPDAAEFFAKRGYRHAWRGANCFDMRLSWDEFPPVEKKLGEEWDGVLYRFAVKEDMPRVRLCTDDIEEDFTPYYMDPALYSGHGRQKVLVAEEKGEIVGTLIVGLEDEAPGLGSVGCTAVRHASRGRHIATRMILLGTAYCKESGMDSAGLGYTYSGLDRLYGHAGYRISSYYFMAEKELAPPSGED
ncbi:MAG: GNAT family N-acetyltransferase [Clostridia bacterium]|nr:GNAT family N-acetyltransferase [Clostridia bacterium]